MSWLRSIELRGVLVVSVLLLSVASASTQDAPAKNTPAQGMSGGCESFKWPLDKERAAFDGAGLEKVGSGAARGAWKEQAFALALVPAAEVTYALAPAKKKKEASGAQFGGVLAFAAPEKAGVYQVTLSGEGWIDIVQNDAALKSADHAGAKNCPGLRKSVRFSVGVAPVVLQISDVPAESIKVAIRPAE